MTCDLPYDERTGNSEEESSELIFLRLMQVELDNDLVKFGSGIIGSHERSCSK